MYQERLSVFEKNTFQGGYLFANSGSGNRTGWNSIIGSFVISKLPKNVRIIGGDMRYDNTPNVHGRGRYRKFGR